MLNTGPSFWNDGVNNHSFMISFMVQVSSLLDRGWFHSELVHYCEISMEKYAFAVVVTSVLYRVLDGRSTPDFFRLTYSSIIKHCVLHVSFPAINT